MTCCRETLNVKRETSLVKRSSRTTFVQLHISDQEPAA